MSKYFIFSFDDGTVHDDKFIKLLKKHRFCGVFNLNSGLNEYVWYSNETPIVRPTLENNVALYDGFEVAGHTLTHPHLTECSEEEIIGQVQTDLDNLSKIYGRNVTSFAIPFDDFNEYVIETIKNHTSATNIRLPKEDESFDLPSDLYHIPITALDLKRAFELLNDFILDEREDILFVFAGHSYDFYLNDTFNELDDFMSLLEKHKDTIKVITMKEFVELYPKLKYKK